MKNKVSGFQRSARTPKETAESPTELAAIGKAVKGPKSEKNKAGILEEESAALTKNITVPVNEYFLKLIKKATEVEEKRTGYKVSGRMLCHKLLKDQLLKTIN